jgi:hypothetical protein
MYSRLRCALLVVTALSFAACTDDGGDDAEALIFPLDFANSYKEVRDCRGTIDHGFGFKIQVAVNPEAESAYVSGTYPLPVGTTLVKSLYEDDEDCTSPSGYSVMKKVRATTGQASAEDWAWQETDALGVPKAITVGKCTSCHTQCTDGRDMTCTDP